MKIRSDLLEPGDIFCDGNVFLGYKKEWDYDYGPLGLIGLIEFNGTVIRSYADPGRYFEITR